MSHTISAVCVRLCGAILITVRGFRLVLSFLQATTSPFQHQERGGAQKDHAGREKDQGRQPETTYAGGAYETHGREEE